MFKSLLPLIKNKFFLVTLAFLIWILFFDRNSIISQVRLTRALRSVIRQKEFYMEEIEKNKKEIEALQSDTANLERFAREKYLMKKDDEDIFIVPDADEQ